MLNAPILYEKEILIKFGEADLQGIMYFNHLSRMAHECLEEFLSQKLQTDYWFCNSKFAAPIRHCASEFFKPLIVGQKYTAYLSVAEMKDTAVTFNCEFKQNQILHAKATTTHVFVDIKTFKKISIPERVREIFKNIK